ncbi:MAG: M48 family metalloprotease [Myxococcota bacterium]
MSRLLFVLCLLAGCASQEKALAPAGARPANLQGAADQAAQAVAVLNAAKAEAARYCAPFATREISREEEHLVGTKLAAALVGKVGPLSLDVGREGGAKNERAAWLAVVGRNLARTSPRPSLPWTFGVVESATPDSFSAPGGFVFVTTGLLAALDNEAQLAGFLSHEIAHVVAKDDLGEWKRSTQTVCEVAHTSKVVLATPGLQLDPQSARFADAFGPNGQLDLSHPEDLPWLAQTLSMTRTLGRERNAELAADALAARLVAFSGYDLEQYERALKALPAFAKHPSTDERVAALERLRKGELAPFAGRARPPIGRYTQGLEK